MKIEVLYFDGCPNYRESLDRVLEVLKEDGFSAEVSEMNIPDATAAQAAGFLGSPSIRINGLDVEPAARSAKEFGLMCRTYMEGGKRVGVPSREVIQTALREAVEAQPANESCQIPAAPASRKRKWLLGASVAAAVGASLCCILPIVAAATGLGTIAAGVVFEQWRPYLLGPLEFYCVGDGRSGGRRLGCVSLLLGRCCRISRGHIQSGPHRCISSSDKGYVSDPRYGLPGLRCGPFGYSPQGARRGGCQVGCRQPQSCRDL